MLAAVFRNALGKSSPTRGHREVESQLIPSRSIVPDGTVDADELTQVAGTVKPDTQEEYNHA
jgi:hypothetical protein